MSDSPRKILVTSALNYANGPLHLGHMVEQIQMDIWARFQRMQGHTCYSIGGCDAHGTPIMLKAQQLGCEPEQLIAEVKASHERDLDGFAIYYDNYGTTHSDSNRTLTALIYHRLDANGDIVARTIEQAFDPEKNIFLPDRYIKGTCPRCGANDQYGDNCEVCGASYHPSELINPLSVLSGVTPILKMSEHFFFNLPKYTDELRQWTHAGHVQAEMTNKLDDWFTQGLQQWDISRDEPYFGFAIPDQPHKYFYVWLDAPIGYMASFQDFCDLESTANFDEFWQRGSQTELHHFIGKDIVYFHALFWPAMLFGSQHRTPTQIHTHGFLTVNGAKMSKSRGTFVLAQTYLQHLHPEYLRYYFAAKLSQRVDDLDLQLDDFKLRVNADLIGKVVNIASRSASFIHKYFAGKLSAALPNSPLITECQLQANTIAELYEQADYAKAVRTIMGLADLINQYIDEQKPWQMVKEAETLPEVQQVCSVVLNCFRLLTLYLKPILPLLATKVEDFLMIPPLTWQDHQTLLQDKSIAAFQPLLQRITDEDIAPLLSDTAALQQQAG